MQQQEHSLGYGFGQAFLFPFRPGVLLYNFISTLCIVLLVFSMNPLQQSENPKNAITLTKTQQQELDIALEEMRQNGADEADIEAFKQLTDGIGITKKKKLSATTVLLILLFFVASYLTTTKNFDITAQIADGDFYSPPLKLNNYVSPWLVIKFFIGLMFVASFCISAFLLGLILSALFPFTPLLLLLLILYVFAMYPAMVLSTIRTNSILGTLNPIEWHQTIKAHINILNYLFLLIFVLIFALLSAIVNAILPMVSAGNLSATEFGLLLVLLTYLSLHIPSSMHYMMGFMTQHETMDELKGDFSGYEKKHVSEKNRHSLIGDIQLCLRNGHPEDADNLLKTLNVTEVSADEMINTYELLINTYAQQGNHTAADENRRRLLAYATAHAPQQRARILPTMTTLTKSGEFQPEADEIHALATAAFNQQDYEGVLKIIGNFAKKHPEHADIVANYFLIAKAFHALKQYEKAHRLLGGLIKKYPQHPLMLDIKSEFLIVKRKLPQS